MGRNEKLGVDYFPHYVHHGKKMHYIENKYGNDGYAVWFKILEQLGRADHHYLDLRTEMEIMYLSDICRVDEEQLLKIIDDLAKLNEVDRDMWKERVLWIESFTDSCQDAWKRRATKCMQKSDLCKHLNLSIKIKADKNDIKADKNPQIKEKERKGKKNKLKEIIYPWDSEAFLSMWELWLNYKKEMFKFKYRTPVSEQAALKKLAELSDGDETTAVKIIEQSIERQWQGFFALKNDTIVIQTNGRNGGKQNAANWVERARAIGEQFD